MPTKHHNWKVGQPPPPIEAHSLKKHEILKDYLVKYILIKTVNFPYIEKFDLVLVDGFAGGGEYSYHEERVFGSPFIMIEAVKEAILKVEKERQNKNFRSIKINVKFFFIEEDKKTHDYLKEICKSYDLSGIKREFIHQKFQNCYKKIIQAIKTKGIKNAIFFLDQYGYKEVQFEILQSIFNSLEKAEVILTFAIDYLVDYLTDKNNSSDTILKNIGFDETARKKTINMIKKKDDNHNWQKWIQYNLSRYFQENSGASFYTPFFIESPKSHRAYWLLHFSMHPRAREAMMSIHWDKDNRLTHYGTVGLKMLGYHPKHDSSLDEQKVLFPDKYFSEESRKLVIAKHTEELPKFIYDRGVISFENVYKENCNNTVADKDIFKEALQYPLESKDIIIIGKNGAKRRKASAIRDTDIIQLPSQRKLFY